MNTSSICDYRILNQDVVDNLKAQIPSNNDFGKFTNTYALLSDNTRAKILWALNVREMCVSDLSGLLEMSKSAVSHQLKNLKDANLVKCHRNGKEIHYSISDDHVKLFIEKGFEHALEK